MTTEDLWRELARYLGEPEGAVWHLKPHWRRVVEAYTERAAAHGLTAAVAARVFGEWVLKREAGVE